MARPSEYDLKKYKGIDIIYALYTDEEGVRYVGYSKDVYSRFVAHLRCSDYEVNYHKVNWIKKNKENIKIKILSIAPKDWEIEEVLYISKYSNNNLLNIAEGGKTLKLIKDFEDRTTYDFMMDSNKCLRALNNFMKEKGRPKRFRLFTKSEVEDICKRENLI